ncbi:ABC transporter substrate-binding protein [Methylovirgula ligni]|nr:ABC transporter substrate-binding protein [Methylovirgula ligni]
MFGVGAGALTANGAEIVDQRGHHATLKAPAQRMVFLPMPGPAMYVAVDGSAQHIVGMNPSSKIAAREGALTKFFPVLDTVSTDIVRGDGFAPNVESILALHPDAVFQWTNPGSGVFAPLENAGLTVFGIRNGGQDDLLEATLLMGQVAGASARAQAIVDKQKQRAKEIADALKGLPDGERPRVLYLHRFSDSLGVNGAGAYSDFLIRLAGGEDVAHSLPGVSQAVTFEQVLAWNPQVILLGNFDKTMPQDIYNDPRWQDVAAVKAHRVYRVPLGGYRWDPPSEESALAWTWLALLLHPDRIKYDLRKDVRDWYRFLYNRTVTDADLDRILFVKQNGTSTDYARLTTP